MTKQHPDIGSRFLGAWKMGKRCRRRHGQLEGKAPLAARCCGRFRVCEIHGDRKTCAHMANLGVLPGSEIELICETPGKCLVRVNGATMSIDDLIANNILVVPA